MFILGRQRSSAFEVNGLGNIYEIEFQKLFINFIIGTVSRAR